MVDKTCDGERKAFVRQILLSAVLLIGSCYGSSWAESPATPADKENAAPAAAAETSQLSTPLPADMFQGRVREAYKVAAEIPEVLAAVTCYCGCNKSHGHRNLLDCFVDDHGAG